MALRVKRCRAILDMEWIAFIASFLLAAVAAWYVGMPLFLSRTAYPEVSARENARAYTDQKERLLQVLKDLELDFDTGKITADEHQEMRLSISQEVGEIIRYLDKLKS